MVWLLLLSIAFICIYIAERFNQAYPTYLVLVGLGLGIWFDDDSVITKVLMNDETFHVAIILVFLSALLGEATLKIPIHELSENKRPIFNLAFIGTLLTFIGIGIATHFLLDLPLLTALVFAALMSATDPISVLSIFKRLGLPEKLSIVVEGESLGNDGIAVVLFKMALGGAALSFLTWNDALSSSGFILFDFVKTVGGGLAIGALFGWLASRLTATIDQHFIEIVLSIILFYGSFFVAEHFHVSGVIAVIVAGLIYGNYGKRIGMSAQTIREMDSFWGVIAFIANALIFLLVGLEIVRVELPSWSTVIASIAIVVIARLIAIFIALSRTKDIPTAWKWVIGWGGLKGSLSIALALSIPSDFPGKELILSLTFFNVLFSLVVQGISIAPLAKRFVK